MQPLWKRSPDGSAEARQTGSVFAPNRDTGFFENAAGERVQPGFKVGIGFANYTRMLLDADFRGPFISIFVWTVRLRRPDGAVLHRAVGMTAGRAAGMGGAALRGVYRTLLFLPYAVPGFISILVFKGLFNQNFGEINLILRRALRHRPAWFADPLAGQDDDPHRQHLARLPVHHDPVHGAPARRSRPTCTKPRRSPAPGR